MSYRIVNQWFLFILTHNSNQTILYKTSASIQYAKTIWNSAMCWHQFQSVSNNLACGSNGNWRANQCLRSTHTVTLNNAMFSTLRRLVGYEVFAKSINRLQAKILVALMFTMLNQQLQHNLGWMTSAPLLLSSRASVRLAGGFMAMSIIWLHPDSFSKIRTS